VVTELEFRLHPVGTVYTGMAMYEVDRAAATLDVYRGWALDEPDESNTTVGVMELPPNPALPEALHGKRVLLLRPFVIGEAEEAERLLAPLLEAAGPAVVNMMRAGTFAEAALGMPAPPPMVAEMHFDMFDEVPDAVIDTIVEAEAPVSAIELRHWGGAMARPPENAGPVGHRDVPFSVAVAAQFPEGAQVPGARAAVDAVADRLRPHATGGSFLNFLADAEKTATAYTPEDYGRLADIKRAYDPDNLFGANHNIRPSSG
jgi:FAD/FMN-containing dehydrogenase